MNNLLTYKNYHAAIDYDSEDNILIGKVCWISDNLTFEGTTTEEIVSAFHETIDEYLVFCKQQGKEPCKEFKGTFNVRISPDMHRAAAICAAKENITLNQFVTRAIKSQIHSDSEQKIASKVVQALTAKSYTLVRKSDILYCTAQPKLIVSHNVTRSASYVH